MEVIEVNIKKSEFENKLNDFTLFKWVLTEKKESGNYFKCVFKRDTNSPDYKEVIELEQRYLNLKSPEMVSVIIFVASSIVFFTLFLVSFLSKKTSDHTFDFLAFLLPAIILFITGSILLLFKSKKILYLLKNGQHDKDKIIKKVKGLQ